MGNLICPQLRASYLVAQHRTFTSAVDSYPRNAE
jgi:hypothetical protein